LSDSCLLRCPNHGRTAVPAVRAFAPIRTGETPVLRCFVIRIAQFRYNKGELKIYFLISKKKDFYMKKLLLD
jgi:hypothetical protein